MFFWGYIEDVKREVVTDFHISAEPIRTTTTTSVGASSMDAYTYTSGGGISSKTKHTTIWTFDIGDTSFKLISDTMHLKNGDFVVVESYSRDGVYYMVDCLDNATKKYSEPSWFPNYLDKNSIPQKPNIIAIAKFAGILFAIITIVLFAIKPFFILGIATALISYKIFDKFLSYKNDYNRLINNTIEQNNWIERHNAEYKEYENKIFSALENEGFLPKKEENRQIQS